MVFLQASDPIPLFLIFPFKLLQILLQLADFSSETSVFTLKGAQALDCPQQ